MTNSRQLKLSKEQVYELFDVLVQNRDSGAVGELLLFNLKTDELECFTIYQRNEKSFYVLLPTEKNRELMLFDLEETFNINPLIFLDE